jgi:hypothetical protein
MRFALQLVARDRGGAPDSPGAREGGAAAAAGERFLATAALEYLDQRDGEWWPLVRLPPLYLDASAIDRLLSDQAELLRGSSEGFAWRPGSATSLALQLGAVPGGAILEVGLDLGLFLADAAGVPVRSEADLALFRFRAAQHELVRFSDALGREVEALRS